MQWFESSILNIVIEGKILVRKPRGNPKMTSMDVLLKEKRNGFKEIRRFEDGKIIDRVL